MKIATISYEKMSCQQEHFFQKYAELMQDESHHVLLESGRSGRYSIAGLHPKAILRGEREYLTIEQENDITTIHGDPLLNMEKWLSQYELPIHPELPEFQGGVMGYISYDYAQCIENLPDTAKDDIGMPILYFLLFDEVAVFDHEQDCLWLMVLHREDGQMRVQELRDIWLTPVKKDSVRPVSMRVEEEEGVSLTEDQFVEAVKKVQHYIEEGDVFQVNLTVRRSKKLGIQPFSIYEQVRVLNPSPYMGYLHTPEFQLISASPELLIRKSGDHISTRPIAGTRPRGLNDGEDLRLANELIQNEKEQAEHIMLVDLERNDLGKVSQYGTVNVDEFMTIEKYSHVMHIVSHVSGTLDMQYSNTDVIQAVFPGGTITGAPKVRTLEIIEELEPVKRGIYTGSLGWIGYNKDIHLNISIRTMLVKDGVSHVQAGAGIVIDSNPKAEYKESLKKAEALWRAKEAAEKEARL